MNLPVRPFRAVWLAILITLMPFGASSQLQADPSEQVPALFFLQGGDYLVRFYFTDDGSSIVERVNGQCVQKITVSKAAIEVYSFPEIELLAEGTGTFNVDATIDCERRFYDFERVIVISAAIVNDA